MAKRFYVASNVVIASLLVALSVVIFTVDMSAIYLTVSAPLYAGNRDRPNVSIVVSVRDNSPYIEPIMDVLRDRGVDATFFVSGSWVKRNMEFARELGRHFELGNHGYSGNDMRGWTEARQVEELDSARQVIRAVTGSNTTLFSPPLGSFGRNTLRAAESLGYTTVMWTRDTMDARGYLQTNHSTPDLIFSRAVRNTKNGDLVLVHPSANTVAALDSIIDYFLTNGFNVVRVSDNI